MQVIHRISIGSTPPIRRELATMGWSVGPGDDATGNIVTFEVDESHSNWNAVKEWIGRSGAVDVVSTNFSKSEIAAAAWLELQPDWHWSYPQPEDEYQRATYDLSEYCELCGIGLRQIAPFRMRGEPKWGRRSILQLNWVFDEYFVTPELGRDIFEPWGISSAPVTDTRGKELKTVVQLEVNQRVAIVTEGLEGETCRRCGRTKYLPVTRGRFPSLVEMPSGSAVRTTAYFGSGASAHAAVLLSQGLASKLREADVRGASVRPVEQS